MKLLLVLLAGCALTDIADGDIERPETCCVLVTDGRIRSCLADFVEPNRCKDISCPTAELTVCRGEDGELL